MPEGRVIGIDPGDARTGVAVSDPLGITAQPREVIHEKDAAKVAERIAAIARETGAAEVVIGLPVNMNGTEGPRAAHARDLGGRIEAFLAEALVEIKVSFWDERMTSMQASQVLRGRGKGARKAKMDVVSAQIILQSYLDARSRGSAT
ncbi:MAG: Holliday junction resolvase RuvX [Planctomycetota bacterium]|jgi:putative Holliday junction resolvase